MRSSRPMCWNTCWANTAPPMTRPRSRRGIETVKEILRKHYVHRNEAGLIQSTIKEKGRYKVIDQVSVALNEKTDSYEAIFDNLGIKKVAVDSGTVKAHPKLLVTGVWCIADVQYEFSEDARDISPWMLETIKPIQIAQGRLRRLHGRRASQFTTEEWIDLLMQTHRLRPGSLRAAQQAAATDASDPLRRAQLQHHRAWPQRAPASRTSIPSSRRMGS